MEADQFKTSGGRSQLRLLSLYASNFKKLKFKHPFNFPEGIVLVTGLNESGKSTVLDAILYALYGRMIRPNQKPSNEDIISYGSGEAQVRLEFAIGETQYRVAREVHRTRPSTAKLFEVGPSGALKTLATTPSSATSEIERLLGGVSYNEIVASSVVAQKDLERLIKQHSDDRRKVINVFLNLDSFNRVLDRLDEERVRIEGTARNPGQLTLEKQKLESLTEKLHEYKEKESHLSLLGEKARQLTSDLSELEKQFADTDALYKTLKEYDETLKQQDSLRKEIHDKALLRENLEQQIASISSKRDELEEAKQELKSFEGLPSIEPELSKASALLDQFRGLELQLDKLQQQEKQLIEEVSDRANASSPTAEAPRAEAEGTRRVWAYLTTTAALGAGAVLSFFLLSALPVLAVAFSSLAIVSLVLLARQIASLSQQADVSRRKQTELAARQILELRERDLESTKQNIAATSRDASLTKEAVMLVLSGIPRYSSAARNQEDPRTALEQVSTLYNKDRQSQYTLEERINLLRRQLDDEPNLLERIKKVEQEVELIAEKLQAIRLPLLPGDVTFSPESLSTTSERRDTLNESVSRVRTQIQYAAERESEFRQFLQENTGIEEKVEIQEKKAHVLEKELLVVKYSMKGLEHTSETLRNRVKPQVERYMGLILPVITSGHYKAVELDDGYTLSVFDPEAGEFRPKEVFSGGTEDQLLLAMRLAFALALMPQAKGQSPEFLFLDEPLGSSDRIRREGILALLHQQLAQNFRQIFLISHVGDLEAEADSIIQMENGLVREVVSRKPSILEKVEVPA